MGDIDETTTALHVFEPLAISARPWQPTSSKELQLIWLERGAK